MVTTKLIQKVGDLKERLARRQILVQILSCGPVKIAISAVLLKYAESILTRAQEYVLGFIT